MKSGLVPLPPISDVAALAEYLSRGRSRRKTTPEGGVLRAICEYLTIKGILWFRMNSGQRIVNYPDGRRYAIKMQRKGTSDLLAFLPWEIAATDGHKFVIPFPVWIEVKAPGKLNKCSRDQQAFAIEVVARGHIHCVVDSVNAVIKLIEREKPWKSGR